MKSTTSHFKERLKNTAIKDIDCYVYHGFKNYRAIPYSRNILIEFDNDINNACVFYATVREYNCSFGELPEKLQDRIILEKLKTL